MRKIWAEFGSRRPRPQIGHTLGAAGGVEAAITALSVSRGLLPPTAGLERPEAPALRHVRAPNQSARLRAALSSSFGFGGACAVLAFEPPSAEPRRLARTHVAELVISGAASYGPAGVLSGAASARYLADRPELPAELPEPLSLLDPERSRRFGRASAIVVATAESALRDARCEAAETGFVVGSAFGDVDRSVRFLQKVLNQGPKFASPAEFPQLIASTGSGNASIYLGLTGPCLSVSEFGTSGQSAVSVAISLLELGLAPALLAGAAEARDAIVDAVLRDDGSRSEGGGFVVLEQLPAALSRGRVPLAVVAEHHALRGAPGPAFAALPPPPPSACIVAGFIAPALAGVLERSKWSQVRLCSLPAILGQHEAIGATALSVAVAEVASGAAEQALVITADVNTVYLTRLCRYEARA